MKVEYAVHYGESPENTVLHDCVYEGDELELAMKACRYFSDIGLYVKLIRREINEITIGVW